MSFRNKKSQVVSPAQKEKPRAVAGLWNWTLTVRFVIPQRDDYSTARRIWAVGERGWLSIKGVTPARRGDLPAAAGGAFILSLPRSGPAADYLAQSRVFYRLAIGGLPQFSGLFYYAQISGERLPGAERQIPRLAVG